MLKKSVIIGMAVISAALISSGCTDGKDVVSNEHFDTDSSYYGVNYTDTGDPQSNLGNSSANVDHSSRISTKSEVSEASGSSEFISSDTRRHSSSRNADSSGSGTTTKTTVTYYYTDETGEHSTDTEIYISSESDISAYSSVIASSENTSETNVSTDSDTENSTDVQPQSGSVGSFEESDLVFVYNGASVYYGAPIDSVVSVLGEPLHIDKCPCSDNPSHEDKTYNYDLFSIEASPSDDGSSYIVKGIQIFGDEISTAKGIRIGMSSLDVIKSYGTDFMICDDEYRYYIDNRYLYFYIQNGVVANIGLGYDSEI